MQLSVMEKPTARPQPQTDEHSFYFEGSSDKGVLLIHGLTGAPVEMRFVGKALNRLGFTVYAPSMAGHCQDIAALEATKYEDWVDSLRGPLDLLKREVRHVYTAGICVGGAVGLMLAHQERSKVEKSVIYSPTMHYDGWNQTILDRIGAHLIAPLRWVKPLHHLSFEERSPFGIKDERMRRFILEGASMKGILHSMPVGALYQNFRLNAALKAALPHMTVPTLLLHAKEDDVSHPRNAEKIKRLHGGECELHYLYDSYHMIHVDRERELVAQMTAEFLGLPPARNTAAALHYEAA
ncbi:MAG: alpha/beta hydrolase [Rhodomicrobium sp.]